MAGVKVIAYTALHYGTDYLAYAIRSVIEDIDEYHVLYSAIGSHGFRTTLPCPDSREQLYASAQQAAGNKLRWHDGEWAHEGLQRESILQVAPDADVILVLDADEIWTGGAIKAANAGYYDALQNPELHAYRLPMVHFWRSFYRAIMHDPSFPVRVIYPKNPGTQVDTLQVDNLRFQGICHMGYAQRTELIYYKQFTHGHRGEWRKDWFDTRWLPNAQQDCHPVGSQYWNPEAVNPWEYLPAWMIHHPYAEMEVIP